MVKFNRGLKKKVFKKSKNFKLFENTVLSSKGNVIKSYDLLSRKIGVGFLRTDIRNKKTAINLFKKSDKSINKLKEQETKQKKKIEQKFKKKISKIFGKRTKRR